MTSTIRHLRRNIVAYVALFFALSAGAYAAGLQPDSVKSKHIKDGQVRAVDLEPNSVGGDELSTVSTRSGFASAGPTSNGTATVSCQAGEVLVGGGGGPAAGGQVEIVDSQATDNGWTVTAFNPTASGSIQIVAEARCLAP